MRAPDPLIGELKQWIAKAENDLMAAAQLLRLGKKCPTDVVCFHAQQCVEKYLKAALTAGGARFPRTHDIATLLNLLSNRAQIEIDARTQEILTDYATVSRYPGEDEPIPVTEARAAVRTARRVRRDVRAILPRSALHRLKS